MNPHLPIGLVDWVQVVNGLAALAAAGIWGVAVFPSFRISGKLSSGLAAASFAICMWYAITNLTLGLGLTTMTMQQSVPFFRYAFVPLVLLPALRHLSQRGVRRDLRQLGELTAKFHQGGDHEGVSS